jgi:hypothetical protein
MLNRVLPLALAVLALTLFVVGADAKPDLLQGDTHEGKIVRVEGNKLIMTDKNGKEHTHVIKDEVRLTLDNRVAKLTDFKPGMRVRVTTKKGDPNTILRIEALDKNRDFGPGGADKP